MNTSVIRQRLNEAKRKLASLESSQQSSKELVDFHYLLTNVLDEMLDGIDEIQKRLGPEIRP